MGMGFSQTFKVFKTLKVYSLAKAIFIIPFYPLAKANGNEY
jgi:hypothetical protein